MAVARVFVPTLTASFSCMRASASIDAAEARPYVCAFGSASSIPCV